MQWNKSEYGDVGDIRVPPSRLWKPDVLMYNRYVSKTTTGSKEPSQMKLRKLKATRPCSRSFCHGGCPSKQLSKYSMSFSADEAFDGTYPVNVVVYNTGACTYIPPGIFKSTCKIDITWFPFDDQDCNMKFGSWTYNGFKARRPKKYH